MEAGPVHRRRWPFGLLVLLVLTAVYAGIAGGAAQATVSASDEAAELAASGAFAEAIQLDDSIGLRTGPLFVLVQADVSVAALNAQTVMLSWAQALDRQGRFDEAIAIVDAVASPALRGLAAAERDSILLDAAHADGIRDDFSAAIERLNQLQASTAPVALTRKGAALLPQYQVDEAETLVAGGNGADAVTILDQVSAEGAGPAALAGGLYPAALLAAGEEELSLNSFKEAAASLKQLVQRYPGSAQAAQAQVLLGAPQPVTGTLVTRGGSPVSGQVRLSSNFSTIAGGFYTTSGPFYYSNADATGTFRFGAVPVGGPYVLEVFREGGWTTYVDPSTDQPATPVTVTSLTPVNLSFVELP